MSLALFALFCLFAIAANAQEAVSSNAPKPEANPSPAATETVKAPVLMPVMKAYKEITIGMTADEVKEKLGKAEVADATGFYYEFSDDESAQIALDADKKVSAVAVIYKVKGGGAPKIEDVLGADPSLVPNENGSVYKLVRYPEAGFWVAYNRTAGDDAVVTVTIQKL
jgi:hypothetical protein